MATFRCTRDEWFREHQDGPKPTTGPWCYAWVLFSAFPSIQEVLATYHQGMRYFTIYSTAIDVHQVSQALCSEMSTVELVNAPWKFQLDVVKLDAPRRTSWAHILDGS